MKKIIVFLVFLIIIIILIVCSSIYNNSNSLDNFVIFNLYENSNSKIKFNVGKDLNQIKSINLLYTMVGDGLLNKKVAPGVKGEFEIEVLSSRNVQYQILLKSKNKRPKNLLFKITNKTNKYCSLEELQKYLKGEAKSKKKVKFKIEWAWEYETNSINDFQDTIDGERIDKYIFDVLIFSCPL